MNTVFQNTSQPNTADNNLNPAKKRKIEEVQGSESDDDGSDTFDDYSSSEVEETSNPAPPPVFQQTPPNEEGSVIKVQSSGDDSSSGVGDGESDDDDDDFDEVSDDEEMVNSKDDEQSAARDLQDFLEKLDGQSRKFVHAVYSRDMESEEDHLISTFDTKKEALLFCAYKIFKEQEKTKNLKENDPKEELQFDIKKTINSTEKELEELVDEFRSKMEEDENENSRSYFYIQELKRTSAEELFEKLTKKKEKQTFEVSPQPQQPLQQWKKM